MKHIKLFENFNRINESEETDLIFDWIPFDSQVNNPANSSMPAELSYSDLYDFVNKGTNESKDLGLYIAHHKTGDGFIRFISGYDDPSELIVAKFDSEYKKTSEDKIPMDKFKMASYLRGTGIASRFGAY
jgi:hypothetical protein